MTTTHVHEYGTWEKAMLLVIPIYKRECQCGEWEIKFPSEKEVSEPEMMLRFGEAQIHLERLKNGNSK